MSRFRFALVVGVIASLAVTSIALAGLQRKQDSDAMFTHAGSRIDGYTGTAGSDGTVEVLGNGATSTWTMPAGVSSVDIRATALCSGPTLEGGGVVSGATAALTTSWAVYTLTVTGSGSAWLVGHDTACSAQWDWIEYTTPDPTPTPTPTPGPSATPTPTPSPTEDVRPVALSADDRALIESVGTSNAYGLSIVVALLAVITVAVGLRR